MPKPKQSPKRTIPRPKRTATSVIVNEKRGKVTTTATIPPKKTNKP